MRERTELQCNFCLHIFNRVIGKNTYEVSCPKCREIDVQPTEFFGVTTKEARAREDVQWDVIQLLGGGNND